MSIVRDRYILRHILYGFAVTILSVAASLLITHSSTGDLPSEIRNVALKIAFWIPALVAPVSTFFVQRLSVQKYRLMQKLEHNANHDELTGLLNRRAFIARSTDRLRGPGHHALLLLDIDWFKRINDTYGHAAGDEALRHVASILRHNAPGDGVVARLGGEEFVAIFGWMHISEVRQAAEKIRKCLQDTPFVFDGGSIPLTTSIGAAVARDDDTIDKLLHRADEALYAAKKGGRNQTLLAA